jgi:hypothetical protein
MKVCLSVAFFLIVLRLTAATSYYSRQAGAFTTNTTWSTSSHNGSAAASAPCACACSVSGNNYFEIDHVVSIGCNLSFTGNPTVVIRSGGSLNVTGNASVSGSVTFDIQAGGVVNITGDFSVTGGGGSVNVDGVMTVGGNVAINGSYPVCGTGMITYSGSLSGSGNVCNAVTVLPVTWLDVSTSYINGRPEISWSTGSEINSSYFDVERSKDGNLYKVFYTVAGAGNSTTQHSYTCIDDSPGIGICYYRIRQVDFDGRFEYSKTVVLFPSDGEKVITIYPTLVNGSNVTICLTCCEFEYAEVSLVDGKGALLKNEEYKITSNYHLKTFTMPPGLIDDVYYLKVHSGLQYKTQKIVFNSH